jgi:hypothetical protein
MTRLLYATLAALSIASPAVASDSTGKIVAEFDGQALEWSTVQPGTQESTATIYNVTGALQISLTGYDLAGNPMKNMLSVNGTWIAASALGNPALDATIILLPDGTNSPYWSSEDAPEPAKLILTVMDDSATGSHIEANFTAQLCARAKYGAEADLSNCKPFNGTITSDAQVK